MRKILIGMAALTFAATGAWAHGDKDKTADTTKSDTSMSASNEVSGQVSKFDKSSRALTVSLPSGETRDLKLATDAKVTRDGSSIGLDQLKQGDNIRASFDPKSNEAKSIDVTSKASGSTSSGSTDTSKSSTESPKSK